MLYALQSVVSAPSQFCLKCKYVNVQSGRRARRGEGWAWPLQSSVFSASPYLPQPCFYCSSLQSSNQCHTIAARPSRSSPCTLLDSCQVVRHVQISGKSRVQAENRPLQCRHALPRKKHASLGPPPPSPGLHPRGSIFAARRLVRPMNTVEAGQDFCQKGVSASCQKRDEEYDAGQSVSAQPGTEQHQVAELFVSHPRASVFWGGINKHI